MDKKREKGNKKMKKKGDCASRECRGRKKARRPQGRPERGVEVCRLKRIPFWFA